MKKLAIAILSLAFLVGCANRSPNPVVEYHHGDEKKSCRMLKAEMAQLQADIGKKVGDRSGTLMQNTALGVTGVLLIVPFFFMDLSGADKIELEALQRRYNALGRIAAEKDCTEIEVKEIRFDPPKEETKRE